MLRADHRLTDRSAPGVAAPSVAGDALLDVDAGHFPHHQAGITPFSKVTNPTHYVRINEKTVRRHWNQARKVNINGETVTLDPAGPLAEAAWAKQRLGRVTQALPNGYCGLPLQQTCPHANACLTCPMFVSTADSCRSIAPAASRSSNSSPQPRPAVRPEWSRWTSTCSEASTNQTGVPRDDREVSRSR
jgi:hypothetical protein